MPIAYFSKLFNLHVTLKVLVKIDFPYRFHISRNRSVVEKLTRLAGRVYCNRIPNFVNTAVDVQSFECGALK